MSNDSLSLSESALFSQRVKLGSVGCKPWSAFSILLIM